MIKATQVKKWLKGKKTYIIGGAIGILGVLQGLEVFEIPEAWWLVMGAFGLGFLRAGVNDIAKTVKKAK